jgi:hypothetical protein
MNEPMMPCDICDDGMPADLYAEEMGMCLECSTAWWDHGNDDDHECSWGCMMDLPQRIRNDRKVKETK